MGRKPNIASRAKILEEAEHVIHLKGFQGASMEAIAKACGMTKANLFHHYGSKTDLALAVLDSKIADFRSRRVEPLCAQAEPDEAVEKMFDEAAQLFGGNGCKAGCFVGNIALEMSDIDENFRERVGRLFIEWASGMADCLERCKSRGVFHKSLDSRAAAEAIVALYEGAIMLSRCERDAGIFKRVGPMARSLLSQYKVVHRRETTMGPKSPCGC